MKASPNELTVKALEHASTAPGNGVAPDDGLDVWLLEDSLAQTPWERMLANDDALRFADSLRAALEKRDAEPQRIDAPAR